MREVERNREGYFVLMRGCRVARRDTRVQNLSTSLGSEACFELPFPLFIGSLSMSPVFISVSSSSWVFSSRRASVTFKTTSRGFPSRAIVLRHVSEPGRGMSSCMRSQPIFWVRVASCRIPSSVGRISGVRCDSRMVR